MGCTGDVGDRENWISQFLKRPVEMTSAGGMLVWKSGPDTLTLRAN